MRPIDADALSALLFKRMGEYETIANDLPKDSYQGRVYYGKVTGLYEVQLAIDRIIPTIDYAPIVHGEWLWEGRYKACSECGSYINSETLGYSFWRYCPYCGAKMDGGKEDGCL